MNQIPPALPTEPKDHKTSLTVFGILTIMGGFLFALLLLAMLAQQPANVQGATPHRQQALLFTVLMYGGLAITLVWLGIGSIMARRWARALLLILSWGVLVTGVAVIGMLAAMSGSIFETIRATAPSNPQVSTSALWAGMLIAGGILGTLLILVPAIWVFFYSQKSVKATCEARDPQERWTDRAPLPIVAASIFLSFGAVCTLSTLLPMHGVFPFFGVYLSGIPGILACLCLSLVWLYAARGMFRLEVRAWWIALGSLLFFPISATITYHQHGILEFYSRAGYSKAELAQLQNLPFLQGNNMIWLTLASSLPWIVYILFIKRYFRRN